jgi:hypothetical protein
MGIDLVFLMTPFFVLQLTLRVHLLSNIFDIAEPLKSLSTNCMVLFASTMSRIELSNPILAKHDRPPRQPNKYSALQ